MRRIWFDKDATRITRDQMELARLYVASRREAFAETLARAIYDDIRRGEWGGTYYMDGRALNPSSGDFYAVGGAMDNSEIVLSMDEVKSEGDVKAAIELLREVIANLQADSEGFDEIGIGFWVDGDDCYFDASNIVDGRESAMQLARHRGELAIYSFSLGDDIRVAKRGGKCSYGSRWVAYNMDRRTRTKRH